MYETYLRRLLAPLGVYDLTEGSVNGAEVYALGTVLDRLAGDVERTERESLVATAEDEGLWRRELLFSHRPAAVTAEERRAALAALLQIDGDSLTPEAMNRTLRGCGLRAKALEIDTGHLRVVFPDEGGEPRDFDRISGMILDVLPCHLEVEFYFRYLTWAECERGEYTWAFVEEAGYSWDGFQLAVPPEESV